MNTFNNAKRIVRVFPRRTKLTPMDEHVVVGRGPGFFDDHDEAHVSVAFTWDLDFAKRLADLWSRHCAVQLGGPALGSRGENFEPGKYLKTGAVITSRGCPNHCWFCSVWRREGNVVRELPITDGWNVLDDNLLRCSDRHIQSVFEMLKRQPCRVALSGGLEAAALKDWHIDLLDGIRLDQMFFAYDTEDDFEPLREAGKKFRQTRFTRRHLRAYCLVGYPGDTFELAERRLWNCIDAGFNPMAMLFRNQTGETSKDWRAFQREWARPAIVNSKLKELTNESNSVRNFRKNFPLLEFG